jgi:hypothetical protein
MDDGVFLLLSLLVLSLIVGGIAAIVIASSSESNDVESRCSGNKPAFTSFQDAGKFLIVLVKAFISSMKDKPPKEFTDALDNLDKKISGKFKISYPSGIRVLIEDECRVLKIPEIDRLTIDDLRRWIESYEIYKDPDVAEIDPQIFIDDRYQLRGIDKRTIPKSVPPKEEIENAGAIARYIGEQRWLVRDLKTNEKKFVSMAFHREDIQDFMTLGKTIAEGPFLETIIKFAIENFKYIKK